MNDKTYIAQHLAAPNAQQAALERAADCFAKALHLWACGYTVASIAREVPAMTRAQIVELVNLANDVAAANRDGQAPVSLVRLARAHSGWKGGAQ